MTSLSLLPPAEARTRIFAWLAQPSEINELCLALQRSRVWAPSLSIRPDIHVLFGHLPHVLLAEHASFDFPVINETFIASPPVFMIFIFASKMFNVIAVARV